MTESDVDHVFSSLGGRLGMPGLRPSPEGLCELVFDGRHLVRIAVVRGHSAFLVECGIGSHSVDAESAKALLRMNYLRGAEGECVFSLSPQGFVNVHCTVGIEPALADNLLAAIENLLNEVERWEERLVQGAAQMESRVPASHFLHTV